MDLYGRSQGRLQAHCRAKGDFRLTAEGVDVTQRLQMQVDRDVASYFVEANQTVIVSGLDTAGYSTVGWTVFGHNVATVFDQLAIDADGVPMLSYQISILDPADNKTKSLGNDTFINARTGKMSLTMANLGRYRITLQAVTPRQGQAPLDLAKFEVHVVQGPGGKPCQNRADQVYPEAAATESNTYGCNCTAEHEGENCQEDLDAALSTTVPKEETTSIIVIGVAATIVTVVLVALASTQAQLYFAKHRPYDVKSMQAELLAELGISAADGIASHEFGVIITLVPTAFISKGFGHSQLSRRYSSAEIKAMPLAEMKEVKAANETTAKMLLLDDVQDGVRSAVATLDELLLDATAHARIGLHEASRLQLIMVMPRPQGQHDVSTAAALSTEAARRRITCGEFSLVDVSLVCPQRIVREVNRKQLTRIRVLGEGAFGEVHQYSMQENDRGIPPYNVAAKTLKMDGVHDAAAARAELLKEGALMALFNHRNVCSLVGVVTTPRDVPVLILLEFCAGGPLGDHILEMGTDAIDTATLLTYIAEVLRGLEYIAGLRIVHRDVALRNVLLDNVGICKMSDFGSSTALPSDDANKEYVRIQEQLPLRWCSVEVLTEGKYSQKSDIWAAGILMWEVFASARLPYSDEVDNLTEVANFVKNGGRLAVPSPKCPLQVFNALMAVCWAHDPEARPNFTSLYKTAVSFGGAEDDQAAAELVSRRNRRRAASRIKRKSLSPSTDPDRTLLGPSVHHLNETLVPGVVDAIQDIQRRGGHENQASFASIADPEKDASIWHMVHAFAKPVSQNTVCPRDGQKGCAYVDILVGPDEVGMGTALLSYRCRATPPPFFLDGGGSLSARPMCSWQYWK